jgi:menaquinone-dependent protoporphyrinogen oxidase
LLDATGLDPDVVGLFAGALAYRRYGWFKRHLMRSIARRQGGDTDMTRDFEYTDWDAVTEFAADALEHIRTGADLRST